MRRKVRTSSRWITSPRNTPHPSNAHLIEREQLNRRTRRCRLLGEPSAARASAPTRETSDLLAILQAHYDTLRRDGDSYEVWIGLAKGMDFAQILTRLEKTLKERKNFITSIGGKLSNENFVARAPQDVIEKERQKLSDAQWESERLTELIVALKQ